MYKQLLQNSDQIFIMYESNLANSININIKKVLLNVKYSQMIQQSYHNWNINNYRGNDWVVYNSRVIEKQFPNKQK